MHKTASTLEELWAIIQFKKPSKFRCRRLGLHDHEEVIDSYFEYCRERFLREGKLSAAKVVSISKWYPKKLWRWRRRERERLARIGRIVSIDRFRGRCASPLHHDNEETDRAQD